MKSPTDADLSAIEAADALSALWAERTPAKAAHRPAESFHSTYSNPENWQRTRGIALIHAETQTLLGNFSEYVHRTVRGCRKLLREEAPIAVSAVEEVSGSWWLGEERKPVPRETWHEQRPAVLHVHLPSLAIHAPAAELTVFLEYGGIRRAELAAETLFAGTGKAEVLLRLPAGLDVLPAMDHDGKVRLRMEIGL